MKSAASVAAFAAVAVLASAAPALAADTTARVGEVRTFIVDRADPAAGAALERNGWIEADGATLPVAAFPELYKALGRTWTGRRVRSDAFTVPDLNLNRERNPFGVLTESDLVTGGRTSPVRNAAAVWIFAGRDTTAARSSR